MNQMEENEAPIESAAAELVPQMDEEPIESVCEAVEPVPPAPTLMDVLRARALRFESTRNPPIARETPKPPSLAFDNLAEVYVALRSAKLSERPVVEPVVSTETEPPKVDAHKFLAVKPAEAAPLQHFSRKA
jgi:hypothetical protein